jgi:hypothetical protein
MTGALARLLADAPGLGRLFFCDIRIATTASDLDSTISRALALAERVLGAIETFERRERPGSVLVQVLYRSGAVAQITVRRAACESLTVELDGDHGSLRLDETGRLLRHTTHESSGVSASHVVARPMK